MTLPYTTTGTCTTCSVVINFSPHLEKHYNTCVSHLDYTPMFFCMLLMDSLLDCRWWQRFDLS